jgi:hypothetical protein
MTMSYGGGGGYGGGARDRGYGNTNGSAGGYVSHLFLATVMAVRRLVCSTAIDR